MIFSIDPSFVGTGVAIVSDSGNVLFTKRFSHKGCTFKSLDLNHKACRAICDELEAFMIECNFRGIVVCEYPAFRSVSGAFLAILNGFLASFFQRSDRVECVCWLPPVACNSFVKNKDRQKHYLVDWCMDRGLISKRISHDICTAIILGHIWISICGGNYKNTYVIESVK